MPRTRGIQLENNFTQGLITETTALRFPENAAVESFDVIYDNKGRVVRRKGFDLETGYSKNNITSTSTEVYAEYLWENVAGVGETTFLVQQQGSTLHIFDVSSNNVPSANKKSTTVDFSGFLASGSQQVVGDNLCQFSDGNGILIVTNPVCDPFFVEYDVTSDSFSASRILLKERDFKGLDSNLELTERFTGTIADVTTNNPSHYYNILNQSWALTDALTQWDSARSDLPSNADYVGLYRNSVTDAFNNGHVNSQDPGNTPAPKGHFILDALNPNRTQAASAEGFTVDLGDDVDLDTTGATLLGDMVNGSGLSVINDGVSDTGFSDCALRTDSSAYAGFDLTTASTISSVTVYGSNNFGFVSNANPEIEISLYGKSGSAPTTGTDGTELGSIIFTDTGDESGGRVIVSNDTLTAFDHIWVRLTTTDVSSRSFLLSEVVLQQTVSTTSSRPRTNTFFASRVFYGGANSPETSSKIYFSKILEDEKKDLGVCYQLNDPTTEDNSDLLASDGGVIVIAEMGTLHKLFPTQTSVIAIASNGVWSISGVSGESFSASGYVVRKLSSIGSNSPMSVVSIRGIPIWWAEDGIYTLEHDANFDSFKVVSVTEETIKEFYNDIPQPNRKYVKGIFAALEDRAIWLYNDTSSLPSGDKYKYNKGLVLNTKTGSFSPWTIGKGSEPDVRGIEYIRVGDRTQDSIEKYTTTFDDAGQQVIAYSDVSSTSYKDWTNFATSEGAVTDEIDYTSYFITGYEVGQDATKKHQTNYLHVFLENVQDTRISVQALFDFHTNASTGRWSSQQISFANNIFPKSVFSTRLKLRGQGVSVQLKFESEEGKPFSLIGWSKEKSSNASS